MFSKLRFLALVGLTCGAVHVATAQAALENVKITPVGPTPAVLDTGTVVHKAKVPCSAHRLCKKGWDLALLGVVAPRTGAALGQPTVLRISVTNLGRVRSPEVPIKVELAGATERLMTPELGAGDTVEMAVRIVPREGYGQEAEATIDPEHLAGDTLYVDNNSATSDRINVERAAELEIAEYTLATPQVRNGAPLRLTMRIRNASKAMPLSDASLVLSNNREYCFGSIKPRVALPTVPPQNELTAEVVVSDLTRIAASCRSEDSPSTSVSSELVDQNDRSLLSFTNYRYTVRR